MTVKQAYLCGFIEKLAAPLLGLGSSDPRLIKQIADQLRTLMRTNPIVPRPALHPAYAQLENKYRPVKLSDR